MIRHEKICTKNPENWPICFDSCMHLDTVDVEYVIEHAYNGMETEQKSYCFYCKKLDKKMYPPKAEHKGYVEKYDVFYDQEKMPIKCKHYSSEIDNFLKNLNGNNHG